MSFYFFNAEFVPISTPKFNREDQYEVYADRTKFLMKENEVRELDIFDVKAMKDQQT